MTTTTPPKKGGWSPPRRQIVRSDDESLPYAQPVIDGTDPATSEVKSPTMNVERRDDAAPPPPPPSPQPTSTLATTADLVVGWLVIVDGPGRGRDFRLHSGMNSVGRGGGAMVDVDFGDPGIASGTHCRVSFDPRSRQFYISPGEGSELTYLLGENVPVLAGLVLTPQHIIEIGQTQLRLAPFCSAEFHWS